MKIRTNFVSNSSSSSFVAIGVSINKEAFETLEKAIEEEEDGELYGITSDLGLHVFFSTDDGLPKDEVPMIGEIIHEFDGEDYPDSTYKDFDAWYKEMLQKKDKIDRLFLKYNIKNDEGKLKILSGIRCC